MTRYKNEKLDKAAREKYAAYRRARKFALDRARKAAEAEIAQAKAEALALIIQALEEGKSKRAVTRDIMNTSNYQTLQSFLEGADLERVEKQRELNAEVEPEPEHPDVTITHEGDGYRVTLAGAELERAIEIADPSVRDLPDEYKSAVTMGDGLPVADELGYIPEIGAEHPVVRWLLTDHGRRVFREVLADALGEGE